jgi:hypothetical protein
LRPQDFRRTLPKASQKLTVINLAKTNKVS